MCAPAPQTLAYNAGMYGRAQALRREGTAPTTLGIADDLPTRFAYESLHALSGMASKVRPPRMYGAQGLSGGLPVRSLCSTECAPRFRMSNRAGES